MAGLLPDLSGETSGISVFLVISRRLH